jgi:hypothetical protein
MADKYEHKEGAGSVFPNRFKTTDAQPEFKGEVKVNGEVMDVAAWAKKTKTGDIWYSLKVSKKREQPVAAGNQEIEDSDVPF